MRKHFYVLGRYMWLHLVPAPPGPSEHGGNGGWGSRFHIEANVHPAGYAMGFGNPSAGLVVELAGRKLNVGIEY